MPNAVSTFQKFSSTNTGLFIVPFLPIIVEPAKQVYSLALPIIPPLPYTGYVPCGISASFCDLPFTMFTTDESLQIAHPLGKLR